MSKESLDYERGLQQGKFEKEMELAPERINLRNENLKLRNNWNELKKWLIQLQKFKGINQQGFSWGVAQEVLDKMQELEGNNE